VVGGERALIEAEAIKLVKGGVLLEARVDSVRIHAALAVG
jgi:hypothetical protein